MNIYVKELVSFGHGKDIKEYTLKNDNGMEVGILNYGGIITKILVPDREGKFENVVLNFDDIKDYKENRPYFGAIIGRVAGRISDAKFNIGNKEYSLYKNDGNNNIHGGNNGFNKKIWSVKKTIADEYISLNLNYLSLDGEEGFPGNLNVNVDYTLNNSDELEIKYGATTDKKTIVNLTNHSYFNLSGDLKEDIFEHKLMIAGNKMANLNEETIPTGDIKDVKCTPFDFTKIREIKENIYKDNNQLSNCGGYDHPFILNENKNISAKLEHKKSGRVMELITNQPVLIFYSANKLEEGLILNQGIKSKKYLGMCFEAQDYPNGINENNFPFNILEPGEEYLNITKYRFRIN